MPRRGLRPTAGQAVLLVLVSWAGGLPWTNAARAEDPAPGPLHVRILRYGTMRAEHSGGESDPALKHDTLSGVVPMRSARIVRQGARIQARYCEGFGIEFQASGLPLGGTAVLLVQNRHPRMTRPDGAQSEEDVFEIRVGEAPSWVGFTFAETWSLVPGRWSFTLSQHGRRLAEQAFEVERAPDVGSLEANGCAAPVS